MLTRTGFAILVRIEKQGEYRQVRPLGVDHGISLADSRLTQQAVNPGTGSLATAKPQPGYLT